LRHAGVYLTGGRQGLEVREQALAELGTKRLRVKRDPCLIGRLLYPAKGTCERVNLDL